MSSTVLRQGSRKVNGRRVEYKLGHDREHYEAILYMRSGSHTWRSMGLVHPSINATAIVQYARDYLRFLKQDR